MTGCLAFPLLHGIPQVQGQLDGWSTRDMYATQVGSPVPGRKRKRRGQGLVPSSVICREDLGTEEQKKVTKGPTRLPFPEDYHNRVSHAHWDVHKQVYPASSAMFTRSAQCVRYVSSILYRVCL
eukprot:scaffold263289_cov19-Tisochrysis_lutea.AAC.1